VDRPARVRVQTREAAEEILAACQARGWQVIVGIEPDQPEDVSDFQRLLNPPEPARAPQLPGRNEPCHCGSGKKFKKCHGA
jgi:SWIM/SEC-C metal-binding protein